MFLGFMPLIFRYIFLYILVLACVCFGWFIINLIRFKDPLTACQDLIKQLKSKRGLILLMIVLAATCLPSFLFGIYAPFEILQAILVLLVVAFALVFLLPKLLGRIYNAMKVNPNGKKQPTIPVKQETPVTVGKPSIKMTLPSWVKNRQLIKPVLILLLLVIVVFIGFSVWQKFNNRVARVIGCELLTPRMLEQFENSGGFRPMVGEICNLSQKNYFLRIAYRDHQAAYGAALTLAAGSKGKHRKLEGVNLVQDDKSSAFFFADDVKLGVLVINEKKSDKDLVAMLKKLFDGDWKKATGNLQVVYTRTVEDDIAGQMLEQAGQAKTQPTPTPIPSWETTQGSKEYSDEETTPTPAPAGGSLDIEEQEAIIAAARNYINQESSLGLDFDLEIQKVVDYYALVTIIPIPAGSFEGGAVIVQKMSGLWVGVAMGTIFPEWEQKVPELFE